MIIDYITLIDYFERIAISGPSPVTASLSTSVGGFKYFTEGDTFDIISAATSKLTYPVLWLETPTWKLEDEGSTMVFNVALVALTKALKDNRRDQQLKRNDMETLLLAVLKQLNHDAMNARNKIRIDMNMVRATEIDRVWDSSNWGWRMEFEIKLVNQNFVC
jgi:hypothetical protein